MNKKILIPLIIIVILACFILLFRFGFKVGDWQYDSFSEFEKDAYIRIKADIPAGAVNQKFFYSNYLIGRRSIYAFTLDKESYDEFIGSLVKRYELEGNPSDESNNNSYSEWYLKKVSEAVNPQDPIYSFPTTLKFDKVIDDDINDYSIILFDSVGTGTSGGGIVANPNTGRIVVFNIGNVR